MCVSDSCLKVGGGTGCGSLEERGRSTTNEVRRNLAQNGSAVDNQVCPPFSSKDHSGSRTVTGLLIMVWYATTGEDRGAGEADETADAASSSPGEFSRVLLAIVTREPLFFLELSS